MLVISLELIEEPSLSIIEENSVKTRQPLEVIVFTDEEGGLIGSNAIIGTLTSEALAVTSHSGKAVLEGIKALGGDPDELEKAIRKIIAESAEDLRLSSLFMPSGAGHDAQNMAKITPTGMIFVPSIGGVSHSPKELTLSKDVANGTNILLHTFLKIDQKF